MAVYVLQPKPCDLALSDRPSPAVLNTSLSTNALSAFWDSVVNRAEKLTLENLRRYQRAPAGLSSAANAPVVPHLSKERLRFLGHSRSQTNVARDQAFRKSQDT
jgi:hypothetical protein